MPTGLTVLVADGQLLFSDALAGCLAGWPELTVLEERPVTSAEVLQTALDRRPAVVLVDYWLPETDARGVTRELCARAPGTTVIHLSGSPGPLQVEASLASGAAGSLPKSLRVARVVEAIRRAVAGESPVLPTEIPRTLPHLDEPPSHLEEQASRFRLLTPRELDVLCELARGRTVDQVARHFGIAYGTARTHVTRILSKTRAESQLEVVAMARAQGLVP